MYKMHSFNLFAEYIFDATTMYYERKRLLRNQIECIFLNVAHLIHGVRASYCAFRVLRVVYY